MSFIHSKLEQINTVYSQLTQSLSQTVTSMNILFTSVKHSDTTILKFLFNNNLILAIIYDIKSEKRNNKIKIM